MVNNGTDNSGTPCILIYYHNRCQILIAALFWTVEKQISYSLVVGVHSIFAGLKIYIQEHFSAQLSSLYKRQRE